MDSLEVPQGTRTADTYRRLAKLMAELGWTAACVRDLTRGKFAGTCELSAAEQEAAAWAVA